MQPDPTESAQDLQRDDEPVRDPVPETGGPDGPEPTRFGDWERRGRCIDF